jgi:hypothetical protein
LILVLEKYTKYKSIDEKYTLENVFINLGIEDTLMNLTDERTLHLIKLFNFSKASPHSLFNPVPFIWFETVGVLNGG